MLPISKNVEYCAHRSRLEVVMTDAYAACRGRLAGRLLFHHLDALHGQFLKGAFDALCGIHQFCVPCSASDRRC